ncbi:MAG: hypothetical protein O3C21_12235, partial [Verrucomicrobia bacterium]|nr:hypothetical protein [Verrucomicrobiota bacterium]
GPEFPSREEVEADRDYIAAGTNDWRLRLNVISNLLRERKSLPDLVLQSKSAINRCRQKLDEQRGLLDKHQVLVEESERRIVLSRVKLALLDGRGSLDEEDLERTFAIAMNDTRAKRHALIDERSAIREHELAIRELEGQLPADDTAEENGTEI